MTQTEDLVGLTKDKNEPVIHPELSKPVLPKLVYQLICLEVINFGM